VYVPAPKFVSDFVLDKPESPANRPDPVQLEAFVLDQLALKLDGAVTALYGTTTFTVGGGGASQRKIISLDTG
jgi:hypothetical protein